MRKIIKDSGFKVTIIREERLLSYYLVKLQKIRIRKTKEKDGKETPEAGAEFEVLNEKKEKMQTLVTDEKSEKRNNCWI